MTNLSFYNTTEGQEANTPTAPAGSVLSANTAGDQVVTIDQDVLTDDFENGTDFDGNSLSAPVTVGGTTYPAGSLVETDISAVFQSISNPDLYYLVGSVSINDEEVGIIMSAPFSASGDQVLDGQYYAAGDDLQMVAPADLPNSANWSDFTQNQTFNLGSGYDNDIDYSADMAGHAAPAALTDNVVNGTAGDDTIDAGYTGDPGSVVDGEDATGSFGEAQGSNDDSIDAGDGNDSVVGGAGDDTIDGGAGNDVIQGDGASGAPSGGSAASGAIGHWNFDDASDPLDDDAALDNDAILQGGAVHDAGLGAVVLDGVDDYVEIPHDPAYDLDNATVTMTFTLDSHSGDTAVFSRDSQDYDGGGHFSTWVRPDNSVEVRWQSDGESYYLRSDPNLITVGQEHDVQITFDNATQSMQLYVDGVLADDLQNVPVTLTGNAEPWTLGANQWHSDDGVANNLEDHMDGQVSFFEIYDGAYTAEEVSAMQEAAGDDLIDGGAGDDTIDAGGGSDTVTGGTGDDVIEGDGAAPQGENLLVNGSFEDTSGMATTGYGFTGTTLPGWDIDATASSDVDVHNDGGQGNAATDGNNVFDFESQTDNSTISQTVSGLTDGETYTLTLDAATVDPALDGRSDNAVDVYWGGELVGSISPELGDGTLEPFSFTLTGGAGDGSDTLRFEGRGTEDDIGIRMDNVVLSVGAQNDDLSGDAGDDTLDGQAGDDLVDGGDGADQVSGGAGADTVIGGDGADTLSGGTGDDVVRADGDVVAPSSSPAPTSSVTQIGLWTFDNDDPLDDQALIDNDAELVGNATPDGNGGISLDGDGDYIRIPHDTDYDLTSATVRVDFTVDTLSGTQGIMSRDSSGYDGGGHFTLEVRADGRLDLRWQSDEDSYNITTDIGTIEAGEEYSVQIAFDNDTNEIEMFLNGASVGTVTAPVTLEGNQEPWVLGAGQTVSNDASDVGTNEFLDGTISHFEIWDDALTPAETEAATGDVVQGGEGNDTIFAGSGDLVDGGEDADGNDVDILSLENVASIQYFDQNGDPSTVPTEDGLVTFEDGSTMQFSNIEVVTTDTDGDGVTDFEDVDDDNDGILDVDEGFVEAPAGTVLIQEVNYEDGQVTDTNGANAAPNTETEYVVASGGQPEPNGRDYINGYDSAGGTGTFSFEYNTPVTVFADEEIIFETSYYNSIAGGANGAPNYTDNGISIVLETTDGDIPINYQLSQAEYDQLAQGEWIPVEIRVPVTSNEVTITGFRFSIENINGGITPDGFDPDASEVYALSVYEFRSDLAEEGATQDSDGDGVADHLDLDSDNDGISDLVESGQDASVVDTNADGVLDGDVDAQGQAAGAGATPVDSDLDGVADVIDLDSDNDGISDFIEGQSTAGYQPGDGDLTDNDADGDGVIDLFDANDGTDATFGGTFGAPQNTDGDDDADYLDDDSDNDGMSDSDEGGLDNTGGDANGDGIQDNTGVTYSDPSGGVDDLTQDLTNVDNVEDEPDFRSVPTPTLDLDFQGTAPAGPGEADSDFVALNFTGDPITTNNGQTAEEDGVGEMGRYVNVATIDGVQVDLVGEIISANGINGAGDDNGTDSNPTFDNRTNDEDGSGTANIQFDGNASYTVVWRVVESGTNDPVSGDFSLLFNDLDGNGAMTQFERLTVSNDSMDAYSLDQNTDVQVIDNGDGTTTFQPSDTDPGAPGFDPTNAVQLTFSGTSEIEVVYERFNAGGNVGMDGTFSSDFFSAPVTVDTNPDYANVFNEGEGPVQIAAGTSMVDTGGVGASQLTITPQSGRFPDGADETLTVTGTDGSTAVIPLDGSDTSAQTVTFDGTDFTVQWVAGDIIIAPAAGGSVSDDLMEQVLEATTYNNASDLDDGVTEPDRVLEITVTNAVGVESAPATSSITAVGVSDNIVSGTGNGEVIDSGYLGDPDGNVIDGGDSEGTFGEGVGNDNDSVEAGGGNDTVLSGAGDDSVDAGTGDDSVDAGAGDDSVLGGAGDDTLTGGAGADTLEGGNDADQFNVADGDDTTTIIGGEGGDDNDSLVFEGAPAGGGVDITYTANEDGTFDLGGGSATGTFEEIESATGTDNNDTLDAFATTDGIDFDAQDGNDSVWGGSGNDTVQGGDGNDTIFGFGGDDSILGGAGDDSLDGDAGDDVLSGGAGDDIFIGDEGADTMDGGDDDDTFFDNADNTGDSVIGGDGNDTAFMAGGNDTIDLGAGDDVATGGVGDDSITGGTGSDSIEGGEGADIIDVADDPSTGGTGDAVFGNEDADIIAANGGDSVDGGAGGDDNDTLIVNDVAGVEINGEDSNGNGFDGIVTFNDGTTLEFSEIENLFVNGEAFDNIVDGTAGDDSIGFGYTDDDGTQIDENDALGTHGEDIGGDADSVRAGDGNDTVEAEGGNDTVDGGDGDDSIAGGAGRDSIDGGDGNDFIAGGNDDNTFGVTGDSSGALGADTIDGGAGNDTIRGNNGDDSLLGGTGQDLIDGQADDDFIDGGANNDSLIGGSGEDTLLGGTGTDTLVGGSGADTLDGGAGNDSLQGGGGADSLSGGDDRDTFSDVGAGDTVDGGEGGDDFDILNLNGTAPAGGSLTVVNDPTDGEAGTVIYRDSNGDVVGTLTFSNIENVIPCFTPGTMIATPKGERDVASLEVGDRIITRDTGIQRIRWVGTRTLRGAELAQAPHLRPILIRAGALGDGLPERDLLVSPQHRVLVSNVRTALYFDEQEVLVAAKHLLGLDGVEIAEVAEVTYIHIMFDQHEIVLSDGAWTESFQPGDQTLAGMDDAVRDEIFALFPELADQDGLAAYACARRTLKRHEAELLIGPKRMAE